MQNFTSLSVTGPDGNWLVFDRKLVFANECQRQSQMPQPSALQRSTFNYQWQPAEVDNGGSGKYQKDLCQCYKIKLYQPLEVSNTTVMCCFRLETWASNASTERAAPHTDQYNLEATDII